MLAGRGAGSVGDQFSRRGDRGRNLREEFWDNLPRRRFLPKPGGPTGLSARSTRLGLELPRGRVPTNSINVID